MGSHNISVNLRKLQMIGATDKSSWVHITH